MNLQSRFESLQSRHASLDARIGVEGQRPMPDADELAKLKREKLRVKEEMERLRAAASSN